MNKESKYFTTGIVYDERYLDHRTGNHPECAERLTAIYQYLKEKGILKETKEIEPYLAPLEVVEYIHSKPYIESIKKLSEMGGDMLDMDTAVSPQTYEVALLAVGGVLAAIDAIMARTIKKALCLVRPPGHHSMPERGKGFCIFNNIAIGARYIQKKHDLKRVAIIDWDVHHGNGTQAAFYDDPTVFYLSIHQFPHYPGTGSENEVGINEGKGYTMNAPLTAGADITTYKKVFEERFLPTMKSFKPDFILISSGFDAHRDDPLAGINLLEEDYGLLTRMIGALAEEICNGRIVSILEGGYNLNALKLSTYEHLCGLMEIEGRREKREQ
ncbi:MAG: histone deacetylase [Candidatus Cloacimonadota bacterium]|nr:MAG: histone deacetylase [Candidatus Cloacimonadota bacterium]